MHSVSERWVKTRVRVHTKGNGLQELARWGRGISAQRQDVRGLLFQHDTYRARLRDVLAGPLILRRRVRRRPPR